jgi:hypothetical protein
MKEQMGERDPADGDAQILHVREIRLPALTGPVPLFKDDLLLRSMQGFPLRDVSLQGAHLDGLVAPGMSLTQQRKQRRPLQGRVSFQLRHDPRPVFFKGVRAGSPRVGTFQFAGQLSCSFIPTGGSFAHARLRGGDLLGGSFVSGLHK